MTWECSNLGVQNAIFQKINLQYVIARLKSIIKHFLTVSSPTIFLLINFLLNFL
jgi:hypothetical protein